MKFKSIILAMSCIVTSAAHATPLANFATMLDQATKSIVMIKEGYQQCLEGLNVTCVQNVTLEQDSIELLRTAVSTYQNEIISGFQNIMGISAVPTRINTLIFGVIQQLTSDPINSPMYAAARALGVPQTVGAIVGSSTNFVTAISTVISDFLRTRWTAYAAEHAYGHRPLSAIAASNMLDFYKGVGIIPNDAVLANATFDMSVLFSDNSISPNAAFLGAAPLLVDQDILVEQMVEAIHAWALAAQLSLSDGAIQTFCSAVIDGTTTGESGNGLYGVMHTNLASLTATAENVTLALTASDVVSSIDTATIEAINTFNKAFQLYVYPKELNDYVAQLQHAVAQVNFNYIHLNPGAGGSSESLAYWALTSGAASDYFSELSPIQTLNLSHTNIEIPYTMEQVNFDYINLNPDAGGSSEALAYWALTSKAAAYYSSELSYIQTLNLSYTNPEIPYLANNISFNLNQAIQSLWASKFKEFLSDSGNSLLNWEGAANAATFFGNTLGLNASLENAVLMGIDNWLNTLDLPSNFLATQITPFKSVALGVYQYFVNATPQPSYFSFPSIDDLTRTTTEAMGALYSLIGGIQRDVKLD